MTSLSPIPEEDLHAYIDGALSPERASAVHAYLCENRAAAERVEAYRRDAQAIARIFSRLDAAEITEAEPASPPVAAYRRWIAQPWVTVAAGLALFLAGLLAGWMRPVTDAQSNDFARFAGEAAATHQLALAGGAPQALDTQSPANLGESLSKVLNSDIRFRPSQATTPAIMAAHLVPVPGGQAAQLTLRDGSDIVTLTMQSRPGAEETPLRRVTAGDVTTIVWQDDEHGLICALTGTAAPAKLEQLAQRVYRDLLF